MCRWWGRSSAGANAAVKHRAAAACSTATAADGINCRGAGWLRRRKQTAPSASAAVRAHRHLALLLMTVHGGPAAITSHANAAVVVLLGATASAVCFALRRPSAAVRARAWHHCRRIRPITVLYRIVRGLAGAESAAAVIVHLLVLLLGGELMLLRIIISSVSHGHWLLLLLLRIVCSIATITAACGCELLLLLLLWLWLSHHYERRGSERHLMKRLLLLLLIKSGAGVCVCCHKALR